VTNLNFTEMIHFNKTRLYFYDIKRSKSKMKNINVSAIQILWRLEDKILYTEINNKNSFLKFLYDPIISKIAKGFCKINIIKKKDFFFL